MLWKRFPLQLPSTSHCLECFPTSRKECCHLFLHSSPFYKFQNLNYYGALSVVDVCISKQTKIFNKEHRVTATERSSRLGLENVVVKTQMKLLKPPHPIPHHVSEPFTRKRLGYNSDSKNKEKHCHLVTVVKFGFDCSASRVYYRIMHFKMYTPKRRWFSF